MRTFGLVMIWTAIAGGAILMCLAALLMLRRHPWVTYAPLEWEAIGYSIGAPIGMGFAIGVKLLLRLPMF